MRNDGPVKRRLARWWRILGARLLRRLGLVGLVVLSLAVGVAVIYLVPPFVVDLSDRAGALTPDERVSAIIEERRSILALLAAIGAAVGIYYTHQRQQLDRDENRTERYSRAIEQLGHGSLEIRLGGIYALERIARDSVRDRMTITDVLSAFVREHTPPGTPGPSVEDPKITPPALSTDVAAALAVLTRQYRDASYPSADLRGANLSDVVLHGGHLAGANLSGADLTDADLLLANLAGANLMDANLTDARLWGTFFTGADLTGANLTVADLTRARLEGANLTDANLTEAKLEGAHSQRAAPRAPRAEPDSPAPDNL